MNLVILPLLFSLNAIASNKDLTPIGFNLIAEKCGIQGPDIPNKKIASYLVGELFKLVCSKKSNETYTCSNQTIDSKHIETKNLETYQIMFEDGIGLGTSESGNIKLLLNLKKKEFQIGQTRIIPDKGMIATKFCIGKVEK